MKTTMISIFTISFQRFMGLELNAQSYSTSNSKQGRLNELIPVPIKRAVAHGRLADGCALCQWLDSHQS